MSSDPGEPIEAGIFNAYNRLEEITLVRNQGMEVDDDMEPVPENVPLAENPYSETQFEVHKWGWDGINRRDVVAQNQHEPSFKNGRTPQSLSYINILLHWPPLKRLRIVLLPPKYRAMKGGRYCYIYMWISTTLFRYMVFNVHLLWMEEGGFLECHPL